VKNSKTGKILSPGGHTQRGYIQYHFIDEYGRRHARYISRLVAAAFIGDIDGFEIDHLDDDNTNNHVSNLEIVIPKVNSQRAYDRGRRVPPRMIPVRIVETGQEFQSLSECARFLNRSISSVWPALRKGRTTAGFHIKKLT
jgi:hypothetical protein